MRKLGIRQQFILASLLILLPMILLYVLMFDRVSAILINNAQQYSSQIMRQVQNQLELLLGEADRLSIHFQMDDNVYLMLSQTGDAAQARNDLDAEIDLLVKQFYLNNNAVIDVLVLSREMSIEACSYKPWVGCLRILSDQWRHRILAAAGNHVITSAYLVSKGGALTNTKVMSLSRLVRDKQGQTLGYVMIEISLDSLKQILGKVSLGGTGFVTITDGENTILYHTDENNIGARFALLDDMRQDDSGYYSGLIENTPMLFTFSESSYFGIRFLGAIPTQELTSSLMPLFTELALAMLVVFALACVLIFVLAFRMTKPVLRITQNLERVEKGDFSFQIPITGTDEIGRLEQGFNTMLNKVEELFAAQYQAVVQEKEAQYQALMATIRPHFLYNALEIAQMAAFLNGNGQVAEMLSKLGKLLRASISDGQEIITLRKEVDNTKLYLDFVAISAPGSFQTDWDVDERLLDCLIPRFILQPLAENAIFHGFQEDDPFSRLSIAAKHAPEESLLLTVEDNGVGMEPDQFLALKRRLAGGCSDMGNTFLAIVNINDRIRYRYGEPYGVKLVDRAKGFAVAVHVPLVKQCPQSSGKEGA